MLERKPTDSIRLYFFITGVDGLTPADTEAGGQPQYRVNNGDFVDTTNTLVQSTGGPGGDYYVELTATEAAALAEGDLIEGRYQSASTTVAVAIPVQIVTRYRSELATPGSLVGMLITEIKKYGFTPRSVFEPILHVKGSKLEFSFQLTAGGVPRDLTGLTHKLGIKAKKEDTVWLLDPADVAVTYPESGTDGIVTFTALGAAMGFAPGRYVYAVAEYDGQNEMTALTPPDGVEFTLVQGVL